MTPFRQGLIVFLSSLAALSGLVLVGSFIVNARFADQSGQVLRQWAAQLPTPTDQQWSDLKLRTEHRINRYEELIQYRHLIDGMIVNRTNDGFMIDQCDSLLFSSLRYIALTKLNRQQAATESWKAISRSQRNGRWYRHPRCREATSRDMIIGVLSALYQRPPQYLHYLKTLSRYIRNNRGFIGSGPPYVSALSPNTAWAIRQAMTDLGVKRLPPALSWSFSTLEVDSYLVPQGYRAHLHSLLLWLELERSNQPSMRTKIIAQNLLNNDSRNLFFRWLKLKSVAAVTRATRYVLLQELLAMKQFPKQSLPQNCERRADYLWQRASTEYQPIEPLCYKEFSGVDFIWMAALLLEDSPKTKTGH